ncbi:hypothetical protein A3SI_15206 [Nitritalea halalkaliphila LW7]|uniref:Uncharacterized protein n=1 Tax=Nitritalea halalkaliphila LW7 TaxID=1189621 RepID=I5BYY6_9BACT|nr:hypothetical protein [Nitritalea halalkaliphila]EIM74788.1 hypothetical protein A3SI_15206 [Nitritalea halalkaliphila LW7]
MSPYAYGEIATPFLNYKVSSRILEANSPFAIMRIERAIRSEMPELILDPEGRFEKLMYHIPWLQDRYVPFGEGRYQRQD